MKQHTKYLGLSAAKQHATAVRAIRSKSSPSFVGLRAFHSYPAAIRLKNVYGAIVLLAVFALASCDLQKTNVNPNASSEVSLSAVLTGAEVSLAFNIGANGAIATNTFIQQTSGANGDAAGLDNYTISPSYYNSTWGSFYTGVLEELKILQKTASERQLPYYSGVARVLSSFTFGALTDIFGDIPYTESLYGNGIVNPKYDKQQDIYAAIQLQLDSAITELSKPVSDNIGATPATDDLIFGGATAKWIATAYTLKARYALHLTKLGAKDAAQKALSFLYDGANYRGIASSSADAQVLFGSAATNANPFYQQQVNRPGWVGLGASFVNLLNGNKVTDANTTPEGTYVDPRRAYFATNFPAGSSTYQGSTAGVPGAKSVIGPYYGTATSPVNLVTYSEAKFIEAEARIIINPSDPLAQTALQEAVKGSFAKVVTNANDPYSSAQKQADYINAKASLTGNFNADLETIITQKYIALFLQPEVWADYRRTGYPALPLAQNATSAANPNGLIPRRILYPQNETSLNSNAPAGSTYQTPKLWWDN
ncbi:SusD/RagB family nutrient-binding outer membrane lipoprotein [Foetidibacter luteolus]|uniref:SusD/RagB family nutrient-binding outer membrane lipoprotein n=1 Tax=Foetidibacter luteolus TaxID=2608880 RepID=UPI00129AEEE0|nr:SusD/RagB family nutrient-binding outer membrane lipoprotein [Foetidibacter luteolus]